MSGGLVGGVSNFLLGDDPQDAQRQQLQTYLDSLMKGRDAPQAGPAHQSVNSGFRGNQQDLITRLEAMSKGQGPSLASEQLKAATDRNMSQQASIASSGRGNNVGMMAMLGSNNSAKLGAQAAQDSAQARIQEQNMAFGQLGGAINQGRNSDEANSQFNAQQGNFRDQANLQAKLQAMGMNDEQIRNIMGQMTGMASQPTQGERFLAGAAGMASMGLTSGGSGGGGLNSAGLGSGGNDYGGRTGYDNAGNRRSGYDQYGNGFGTPGQ